MTKRVGTAAAIVAASLVGYAIGVVTLIVWSGKQLYEGMVGGKHK